jgi:hypothetical protein
MITDEPPFNRKMLAAIRSALFLVLMGCVNGCTHIPLRNNTGRTASTLIDLHYRQVLDNVARLHDNPVGRKKDVPANACCVGSHANTYAWVTPEGMNGLAVFAMGALDLATGKMHTPQQTVVRKYKGEPTPENLVETQVTSTEEDEKALEAIRKGRVRRPERERNLQPVPFNPGLLTLPH